MLAEHSRVTNIDALAGDVQRRLGVDPVYFGDQLVCEEWVDRMTCEPVNGMVELLDRMIRQAEPYGHSWCENDHLIFDNTTMLHRRGLEGVVGERELSQSRLLRVPAQDASFHATADR